jgi:hypothetical protein
MPWAKSRQRRPASSPWATRPISRIRGLPRPCCRVIGSFVHCIKATVALLLELVWFPAVSCCLIDASGLLAKRDCCSKKHSHSNSGPVNCDKPCGALASASYLSQQDQLLLIAPVCAPLFDCASAPMDVQPPAGMGRALPATAPPELSGHWQLFIGICFFDVPGACPDTMDSARQDGAATGRRRGLTSPAGVRRAQERLAKGPNRPGPFGKDSRGGGRGHT